MSATIGELPAWEIEFDTTGALKNDGGLSAAGALGGVTNLFVFSHGWNTSDSGARNLYETMFPLIADQVTPAQRQTVGVVGVIWPSLLFPEDGPADGSPPPPSPTPPNPPLESTGAQLATALGPAFPDQAAQLQTLGTLIDQHREVGGDLDQFHELATGLVTTPAVGGSEDRGEETLINASAADAITAMAAAPGAPVGDTQGVNPFATLWHGARELLRTMSYYEMKNRAGVVGKNGLGPLLGQLQAAQPDLRIHLMGHSFGARLVAFSLAGLPASATGSASPVKSLLLVQGAFSHYAFSDSESGALRSFRDRVDGPFLATFSAQDRAVGLWYPNASRLAQQSTQSWANFNLKWGGMGADGYQQSGETNLQLAAAGDSYSFSGGGFYRLDSNAVICRDLSLFSGAHSDICHPEVAWAAVSAAGL